MSVRLQCNEGSPQKSCGQFSTDSRYGDLSENINLFSSSPESLVLQENGRKLSLIVHSIYERYRAQEKFLSAFCSHYQYNYSAELKVSSANGTLKDLEKQIHGDLNAILGEGHGIDIPENPWAKTKVSISELLERLKAMRSSFFEAAAEKLGCKLINRKVELVYTDAATKEPRTVDSSHLDCVIYAFYRLREEKAAQAIFFKEPLFGGRSRDTQLQTLIEEFGYRIEKKGQKGDKIVYLNERGLLCHTGVMVDEKTVHSKLRTDTDEIVAHPIESVPECYRPAYLFLRKEPSTLDQPWVLWV